MKDFTLKQYYELIKVLQNQNFSIQTFENFVRHPKEISIVLRYDVDKLPQNSLTFAKIQHKMGIVGTYYFRVTPQSFDEQVIKEIAAMGHEIGYHYETMDTCHGNVDKAYDMFCHNLEMFRKIVPIITICMHGSPLSKFDNRAIWDKYDYHKLGLIAEPYFDLDFNKTFYITDTGRRWDGDKFSFRDKSMAANPYTNPECLKLRYHTTADIINAIQTGVFPHQFMMTFHPQRWTDSNLKWLQELIGQNLKNQVKRFLIKKLVVKST